MTETHQAKKIPLAEPIFGPTIQGEGLEIGRQTYFVRFAACDYRCAMCDSMHAVDPDRIHQNATWHTQGEIFKLLTDYRAAQGEHTTKWVVFTGGNPAIHDLSLLQNILLENEWSVMVETQGSIFNDWLNGVSLVCVSPKGPGMGAQTDLEKLDYFLTHLTADLFIKIVVFDERDLEFARMIFERYSVAQKLVHPDLFFLSLGNPYPPGHNGLEDHISDPRLQKIGLQRLLVERYEQLLPQIYNDPSLSQFRFLPQWHVIVWGNKQGV